MNSGMKMMLVSGAQNGGTQNGRRYGGEREKHRMGGDSERVRTRDTYEPTDGGDMEPEMRGTRRRRYDNGRFRPTRSGADYLYAPEDDDDDETEAGYPYMPDRDPPMGRMNQIGFVAGGHSKVTDMHRGGSRMMDGGKLDKATAEEWMRSMKNEDGTTGPHWSMEQAKQVMAQKGVTGEPVEFWTALNMIYSDYCKVAKKLGTNNIDFYVEMAKAFLDDKDAGEGKLMKYYEYVVK